MKKIAGIVLFLFIAGLLLSQNFEDIIFEDKYNNPFPEFYPINFDTPLKIYKRSIEKTLQFTYTEKIIKQKNIKRFFVILQQSDTLSLPIDYEEIPQNLIIKQLDTVQILYFYENGKLKQILFTKELDNFNFIPMKSFEYFGDTTLMLLGFGNYYTPDNFYFNNKEDKYILIKNKNIIEIANCQDKKTHISTFYILERFYLAIKMYKNLAGTNSWLYAHSEEELDKFHRYKTEVYFKMNKDNLPYFFYVRYISKTLNENFLYTTQIKYEDKIIKEIYENKYKLFFGEYENLDSTKLIFSDTLKMKYKKGLMQIFFNNELIFEREKTKKYIWERNYETNEFRYLQLKENLPVYEYLLTKYNDNYILSRKKYNYETL